MLLSRLIRTAVLAWLASASAFAAAQELVIGLSTPVTSLDPHFHNLTPNNNVADHVFEKLVGKDAKEALSRRWPSRGRRSTTRPGSSSCARA